MQVGIPDREVYTGWVTEMGQKIDLPTVNCTKLNII